jgi:predicted nucleic acid-binding protein
MPFVLDASVAVAWCFDDEQDDLSARVLERLSRDGALAPAIWPLEVANAVRFGERRGRLRHSDVLRFEEILADLRIEITPTTVEHVFGFVLDVSREYQLSAYDAAYLELAISEGLPLATLDQRLMAAADAAGVQRLT